MSTRALANPAKTLCGGACTEALTCVVEREDVERAALDECSFNNDALMGATHAIERMIDPKRAALWRFGRRNARARARSRVYTPTAMERNVRVLDDK